MAHTSESELSRLNEVNGSREVAMLQPLAERDDIESTMAPFRSFPEYKTVYPESVTRALGDLYVEYHHAIVPAVLANREWDTDYQFGFDDNGMPVIPFIRFDIAGLPQDFLREAEGASVDVVREAMRGRVFEIESTPAMYGLMMGIFSQNGHGSRISEGFRGTLDAVRQRHGKPIALLSVTDEKHQSIRETEFGKQEGDELPPAEVARLSGFDALFGPADFVDYVRSNRGRSDYLLYVRASEPVSRLRKPDADVEGALLADENMRRLIKANAITFNVDDPGWSVHDPRRINDTKEYLPEMRMAQAVRALSEVFSADFIDHILAGKPYVDYPNGQRLSSEFSAYLSQLGISPEDVEAGRTKLRGKPMKSSYGSYGHMSGSLHEGKLKGELIKGIRSRGPYVLQPEVETPVVVDEASGTEYTYIDRNLMAFVDGSPRFIGGLRAVIALDSIEAQSRRIHGSSETIWAEILRDGQQ